MLASNVFGCGKFGWAEFATAKMASPLLMVVLTSDR
jgi:hypothetical protein